jgi:hypothetical protein
MRTTMKHESIGERVNAATVIVAALAFSGLAGVGGVGGCQSKLETGYEPRALGSSSSEVRRGYYAQPFSPDAIKARQYQHDYGDPTVNSAGRARPGM